MRASIHTLIELQRIHDIQNVASHFQIDAKQMIDYLHNNDRNTTKTSAGVGAGGNIVNIHAPITTKDYSEDILMSQFSIHKSYYKTRKSTTKQLGLVVRLPCIPEDISENIIKFILHNRMIDPTSRWDCSKGDLESQLEGKQECKCFTSCGPLSFTPSSHWDVIYFLDARKWIEDVFVLYKCTLTRSSPEWKNIKVNKSQTFEDQTNQGRRPRLTWELLRPQIAPYCTCVFKGGFDDIFKRGNIEETPLPVVPPVVAE